MQDNNNNFKHWRLETDADKVLWIHLDKADSATNTLSEEVLGELDQLLTRVTEQRPAGAIFLSDKANGFIAGADIKLIERLNSVDDPEAEVRTSQALFDRIEGLPFPTCAAIHGFCLGGGLELALACDYRVADEDPSTRLGLPEVMLGVHPGWGGTVRLPRLIGAIEALPLMLQGKTVVAKKAQKLGLVDYAVARRQLLPAAKRTVLEQPRRRTPDWKGNLTNQPWLRKPLAWKMREEVGKKARPEHYPAPYAIIDLWEKNTGSDRDKLAAEAHSFVQLAKTEASQNLIRVFFLQERMKELGKGGDFRPKRVHVVGAGTMGGDIAAWCASRGMTVTLQDREPKFVAPAIKRAGKLFEKTLRDQRLVTAALDRLVPDIEGLGVTKADVIIEAVPERLELKQQVLKGLEARMKPQAVLATNTSSIPLDEIAAGLAEPEKLVGIHFFNPVAKMQLVEVVTGPQTAETEKQNATAFVTAIGRLPLPVKSSPGFLVNRVLTPYLMEAVMLIGEGVSPTAIDEAAERFGMPMGPVELADTVGLDICLHVGEILAEHLGGEPADAEPLRKKVAAGELGRKSGRGFYEYKDGKPVKPKPEAGNVDFDELADRMVYRMINEAVACLREGVVADADLLDAGMIFGTGFAPFRGGPLNYVKRRSVEASLHRLQELESRYGSRFTPDAGWDQL
jgi:3-hydroxyacyl-CoA dehydrogenase/enoyl-CoA hydratase/3-hydroxybutyryl-CoA epimerase